MDDKKRIGLIVTIVTVLLCGLPGLCILASGAIFALSFTSQNSFYDGVNPQAAIVLMICAGVIGLLIPLAAGIYTIVQSRKAAEIEDIEVPDPL